MSERREVDGACEGMRSELAAFLDDELPAEARARVEAHLGGCAGCRAELEGLWRALEAVDHLPATQPGQGFEAAFELALARERGSALRRLWTWLARPVPALALGGAAAGLLLLAGLLWLRPTGMPPGAGTAPWDELAVVEQLDLYADLEAVEQLDLLEDLEAIESLEDEG